MSDDPYDFWRRRLSGETVAIQDGEPQAGFYRVRSRDKTTWRPVAYWFADGLLRCRVDGADIDEQRANELWLYASKNPIAHETYEAVIAGGSWPDLHDAASEDRRNFRDGDNDESFEAIKDRIDDLAREAEKLIKSGGAKTQEEADRASDLANRLGELWNKADDARKAEKKPHDDAAAAVQEKWRGVLIAGSIYKQIKAVVVTPFLAELDRRRKAAEAEARKAAEQAAKDGAPAPPPPPAASAPVKAGSGGRRSVALRTVKQVEITDRAALLAYFADGQAMTEFLQTCAEKAVRAGVTPAGVTITETQVAA